MRPACFNRPPRAEGRTVHGFDQQAGKWVAVYLSNAWTDVNRCATWDGVQIGQNGERYPEAHGWVDWCRRCVWLPEDRK